MDIRIAKFSLKNVAKDTQKKIFPFFVNLFQDVFRKHVLDIHLLLEFSSCKSKISLIVKRDNSEIQFPKNSSNCFRAGPKVCMNVYCLYN